MKNKKTLSIYILIAVSFTILYLILASKPLTKEYQFTPEWKISALNPVVAKNSENSKPMHFMLGQSSGYFTEKGEITLYNSYPSKIAMSDSYYALYSAEAKDVAFYDSEGKKSGTLEPVGFPYFQDDQIFVFLPGGNSIAKCNSNGKTLWTIENTIPITAFSSNKDYCAIGYANGNIKVYENEFGKCTMDYFPGGSDLPVILGISISKNGEYIASISGHNRQRFVVAKKINNQPKIIYHSFLKDETNERTLVYFTSDDSNIFFNYGKYLGIYNLETKKEACIPVDNRLISVQESNSLVYLLGKNKHTYTIYIVEKTNTLEGKFSFNANMAFIKTSGDNFYIGKDNTISKVIVSRE